MAGDRRSTRRKAASAEYKTSHAREYTRRAVALISLLASIRTSANSRWARRIGWKCAARFGVKQARVLSQPLVTLSC